MKDKTIEIKLTICQPEELSKDVQRLIELAKKASTESSYAPYSHFHVGAALRLTDGTEVIGANQENAAFPVTICAERSAVFAAQAQHPGKAVTALAIAASDDQGQFTAEPVTPCGSCRQAILETEQRYGQKVTIYLYGTNNVYVVNGIQQLLPLAFIDESME